MAETAAGEPIGGGPAPGGEAQPPDAQTSADRLAEQIAERVYRLMLAEARLSRARGQQPPLRRQVRR